ncbi:PREDICTED: chemokine-like receptor 1 [Gekko japonicus]|uniref:Chemokine-like receptor 1 n=1 Tax=Gekko japonicus TaxID=146911 RepID=A0ABM1LBJ2_GEKJA|nr:PREDICTED: chemokine-like receptor 1 [Gekko japonicus]
MENTTQLTLFEVAHLNSSVVTAFHDEDIFQQTLWKRLKIFSLVIRSLVFLLGLIGNGLVIFIAGFRMKKTVNTIWFLNLAIADFTFILLLPLSIAYLARDFHWPFGEAMCKFSYTVLFVNLYTSVYLLMVISIDRCISVLRPVWAQNHRNPRWASFVAFGVWVLALVLSSPNILIKQLKRNGDVIHCHTSYSPDAYRAMSITLFIFAFVIPFLVIVICYGAIVLRLRRDRLAQSSKPFRVITAVIVAFFVCWFPFHVFSFLEIRGHEDPRLHLVLVIGSPLMLSLTFFNSCLNPILYVFMVHDFKESLKRSILTVFENAFAEEERQSMMQTKPEAAVELDSLNL